MSSRPSNDSNTTSTDQDPTDFEGIEYQFSHGSLPALFPEEQPAAAKKDPRNNAATGASAAGVRAFTAQAVAFYFRAPVKAFFRTRVDYLAYARNLQQEYVLANARAGFAKSNSRMPSWFMPWWRNTTPGLLAFAIRTYGWRVLPEQVMPPLVANVAVGAVLYTSYLQILGRLHEPSGEVRKRVFPPPPVGDTLLAGMLAGGIQSLVAAPLDALQVRYDRRELNGNGNGNGKSHCHATKTMWVYGREKFGEIGVRGIFAGWGLSFAKDSLGSGVFFSTFEWVKAQGYYRFVRWYYGALREDVVDILARKRPDSRSHADKHAGPSARIIKPHYALEPTFLLLAGMSASIAQQGILYPLSLIQTRHYERLESLDARARRILAQKPAARKRGVMLRAYMHAYRETWRQCCLEAGASFPNTASTYSNTGNIVNGSTSTSSSNAHSKTSLSMVAKWLYRGFWWHTIRQVPSTSAGLIIFELVRRKYGMAGDEVRINQDGYDILLT